MGWAYGHPAEAKAEGKYPTGMSRSSMKDFASTPEAGLPEHANEGWLSGEGERYHYIGHDADGGGATSVYPPRHALEGVFHRFAKTTEPEHMEDGSTGAKHWIQGMVNSPSFHKGALTAKANKAGETPMQFAHSHEHAPGRTGRQARAAINMQK